MGTHSRNARPGQNSGIGKRPTRARGIPHTSASHSGTSSVSSAALSSSRPGSAHKKLTSTTSSRRGSPNILRKPVSERSVAATTHRQAPACPSEDEEIVAEIVVKTDSTEDSMDMDDESSEISSMSSFTSDLDAIEPTGLAAAASDRHRLSQSPPVERDRQTIGNNSKIAHGLERNDDILARSSTTRDTPAPGSLDHMSLLDSSADDVSPVELQTTSSSPALVNAHQPGSISSTAKQTSIAGGEVTKPASAILNLVATTVKDMQDSPDNLTEDEPLNSRNAIGIDTICSSEVREAPEDPQARDESTPDPKPALHKSMAYEEKVGVERTHEMNRSTCPQTDRCHGLPDEGAPNQASSTGDCRLSLDAEAKQACLSSVQKDDSQERGSVTQSSCNETARSTNLHSVDTHQVLTQSKPLHSNSSHLIPEFQTSKSAASPSIAQSTTLLPVKSESTEHTPQIIQETISETTRATEMSSLENVAETRVRMTRNAIDSLEFSSRAEVDEASESELSEVASTGPRLEDAAPSDPTPFKSAISHLIGESRPSFASSASALTERSGMSSKPPSVSSKATTPLDAGSPREPASHVFGSTTQMKPIHRLQYNVRPKVSVPTDLTPQEYAIECIEAAENSRLNPYALHQEEYLMLRSHISHAQVTTYLNIRNGILRLWVRNPQIAVTREEAIGCAKDTRWFDVANVCFDWLVRRGFINYGCVEIRQQRNNSSATQSPGQRTIVVIGAGFSGLGCARQLTGLSQQYAKRFREMGEEPPRVIVLEGRTRVGGRVYSRAFQTLPDTAPGIFRGKRFTAEMGGMIITGFDRGNPLNILVRGQLGLPYHCLRSDMSLYDTNGTAVDPVRDQLVEHLFNACLDRVSEYKFKTSPAKLIEGNHDLMDEGKDSSAEGHKTIALVEEAAAAQPYALPVSEQNVAPQVNLVPVSTDRMTGKVHVEPGTPGSTRAAFKARSLGWTLKAGVSEAKDIELDAAANDSRATLGSVVDEALMQHKEILDLNAQDFRLLNWHIANLEYSNATSLNKLSIKGWDIDAGNEWEGKHTMVVGGYQSVARGLLMLPAPLNIQHKAAVKRIAYSPEGSTGPVRITLEDGQTVDADYVVNTIPLGVLKHGTIEFQPSLPSWKTKAIERLGFGVLNKVILIYKEAFWDKERDIFGMLQTPTNRLSLNQKDYASRRGRFFQWFNVTNTTGMPCLLALMAGDAGYDTEVTPNDELIAEATEVLRMRYGARVTQPLEAIVTRWESDRFARGSYSNAGINMTADDYNLMAKPLGNMYFAGEHTTVTHPATVHGAYLSGLRAAAEVFDSILGPIEVPTPLVLPRETSASLKRKAQEELRDPAQARLEAYELEIAEHIRSKLGPYPLKPAKVAGNPYLLFNKANYEAGRKRCEEGRRVGKGKPSPNEVRTMTSKMWKEAPPEIRKPFEDQAEEQKRVFAQALKDWTEATATWEREATALREKYMKEHPSLPTAEELAATGGNGSWAVGRRAKRVESYAEDDSDVDMD